MDLKCHHCGAPLYSRRTKVCDRCGTPVPPEMLLDDEEIRTHGDKARSGDPSALLPRDFAVEFEHRNRRGFLIGVATITLALLPVAIMIRPAFNPSYLSFFILLIPVSGLVLNWKRITPICPNCRQNIRTCKPVRCHLCGDALKEKSCRRCDVDFARRTFFSRLWKTFMRRPDPLNRFIDHCPGCGVYLDTCVQRQEAREDAGGELK